MSWTFIEDQFAGDPKNDSWIFALAVLLSSTFVYNSMSTINHQALEQLHYVTELTELIRAKSSSTPGEVEDSFKFVSFFPDFVWTVRDFLLELVIDGHSITEDEYLEDALKLIPGKNPKIQNSNVPRECIRHFFPNRKCFVFDRPTNDKHLLLHMETVSEDQLDSNFQRQLENFCSYIFTNAKTKTLREGIIVTGNRLGILVETYVDAINSGSVPCLENAVTTLAQRENAVAVQKAADHYSEQMAQRMRFPTDTLQELLDVHAACEREAISVFMECSFKDDRQEFQKKLMETIEKKKEDFSLQNEEASVKYCQAELKWLSEPLMEDLSRGTFSVPGGHSLYLEAKKKVEHDYELVPGKGVKANEILQSFLQSQAAIEKSILHLDKSLTAGEKAIAAERAKKEAAEKEQELLRQKQKEQQQMMEARERSYQENLSRLKEKMEKERENLLREQKRMLEHKLKVQKELLNEGFKMKSEELHTQIYLLTKEIEKTEKCEHSLGSWIFDEIDYLLVGKMQSPDLGGTAKQSKKEAAEKEQELLRQKQKGQQQMMETQERSFQENMAQLKEKMEQERENLLRGQERMLEHKLKATVASEDMRAPICLVENKNMQLSVNQQALQILEKISQPVVVVAIVGLYHTGKSYLMNRLIRQNRGFPLGSTVQSETKGIWMWCVPHPCKPNHTLVLLDTDSLDDVEKSNPKNDLWISVLVMLLSSTFIYNSMGTINNHALEKLLYVTEMTDRIRANSSPDHSEVEDSADFVSFFPAFVWTLRDFPREPEANGQPINADEYLELSLKLKQGTDQKSKNFNEPQLCIRKFFPERKCFIFDRPAPRKYLVHLEQLKEEDLNPEFIKQTEEFYSYILSHSNAKTLPGGITVNGPRLKCLVLTYINAISSGELPCMENAVLSLAQIENSVAVQKAIAHYDQQMSQKVQLPTETFQELLELHRASEREAIEVFMKNSFKDVDQKFQKKLKAQLKEKQDDFCKQNVKASSDHCMALLQDIFGPLEEDVKRGLFSKPGGYHLFIQRKQELEKKYHQAPRKGIQAEEMLNKYFKSKEDVADSLLQTDQSLTEKEREIEVECIKAESAEAVNKILKEIQKKNEQMMEQKERSYREHVKQLIEKMEQDRALLKAEQERTLTLKLQEQERLLKEGFQNESRALHKEIHDIIRSTSSEPSCNIL
ncbi:uncharacterized protein LOC134383203 isoform X2 [Cynocephalus volans]|uniref:uncharacterized protein LOC134383203 isoform X2 n=1 Tax=Cynocephalus volans TaxID=110931 RepID=UPI002FC62610